jgi:metallo-beta-lactamase family protein
MDITFHGAARTTTGSMHLLDIADKRILFDCGIYQGKRKEAFEHNRHFPFDVASIDRVVLSHAHIDHCGNLPTLVKQGFRGEILATPATRDLCDIMLRDSAHLQIKDVEYANKKRKEQGKNLFEPLYTPEDIDETMDRFRAIPYEEGFEVASGAVATFHDAGHLLGSASITVDVGKKRSRKRLFFTGDMGRKDMPILLDPTMVKNVNVLITESTYGNRVHPPKADVVGRLKAFIEDITLQRAKLIIPSFSVGRTQEIVYFLNEIYEKRRIAPVPVYVDSPLSSKATAVYEHHRECFDEAATKVLMEGDEPFHFRNLKYVTETEESKKLNDMPGPMIIISSSGMCEGGRIVHHLMNNIENPRNVILFVGYQAENTLGRRIVDHVPSVRMFGKDYQINARIHTINALSAHADRDELVDYFTEMGPRVEKAFVVHGEVEQSESLAVSLRELGAAEVIVPAPGQKFEGLL